MQDDEDVDAEEMAGKAVDAWLAKLDDLAPEDGLLTQEILLAVGEFPVVIDPDAIDEDDDPSDIELERVGALAYSQGWCRRRLVTHIDKAMVKYGKSRDKRGENDPETVELRARVRYWESVQKWVANLQ